MKMQIRSTFRNLRLLFASFFGLGARSLDLEGWSYCFVLISVKIKFQHFLCASQLMLFNLLRDLTVDFSCEYITMAAGVYRISRFDVRILREWQNVITTSWNISFRRNREGRSRKNGVEKPNPLRSQLEFIRCTF